MVSHRELFSCNSDSSSELQELSDSFSDIDSTKLLFSSNDSLLCAILVPLSMTSSRSSSSLCFNNFDKPLRNNETDFENEPKSRISLSEMTCL